MSDEISRTDGPSTTPLTDEALQRLRARKRALARREPASLLIYSRDGVRVVPLAEGHGLVVGRDAPSDIRIRDASLSRQHCRVAVLDGEIWIEDLGSTNGTRLDGEIVERSRIEPGAELTIGTVTASVHTLGAEAGRQGPESHDRFAVSVEAEVARARTYGRKVALVMLRATGRGSSGIGALGLAVAGQLRPFDRHALYSEDTLEILLPEMDENEARRIVDRMTRDLDHVRCAIGVVPVCAAAAEELMEVTRATLLETSSESPLLVAPASAVSPVHEEPEPPVAGSEAMSKVFATARKVATSMIPVLVLGETGSGKEVVARVIHEAGPRRDRPLLCVNCAGIPSQLLESTLFGHERGAFTGAARRQVGVFEAADGGTVFLDEVAELPPPAQAALLRVLESRRFARVGSTEEIEVDVRIVAATHRDLEAMCEAGDFRWDLLYRLNAMTLHVPPLRERPEDIAPLVLRFVALAAEANARTTESVDDLALEALSRYRWPGNIRELRNAIDRAVVIAEGGVITVDDLPERVRLSTAPRPSSSEEMSDPESGDDLRSSLERLEARLILDALRNSGGDRRAAARRLGLPLRTLARKMRRHGIRRDSYRQRGRT